MAEKWEYCVIRSEMPLGFSTILPRVIYYFDMAAAVGMRKEIIGSFDVKKGSWDIDGAVIARLGNQGWELTTVDHKANWFYFKRRVDD